MIIKTADDYLLLNYINDFPDCINCNFNISADDTLLYAPINYDTNRPIFQTDIDSLHRWFSTNKMPFNTAKREVIAFNNRESVPPSYKTGDYPLNHVSRHSNAVKPQV